MKIAKLSIGNFVYDNKNNKVVKILSIINPTIIVNNISILLSHKVNMFTYFKDGKDDFNLIKVEKLDKIINQLIEKKVIKKYSFTNFEKINAIMVNSVFKKAKRN